MPRSVKWSRATLLLAVCLFVVAIPLCPHAAPAVRCVAVVVGVSAYDASTGVGQLPACETSARALAEALQGQADVRTLLRRVERQPLLTAIRQAAAACGPEDVLMVLVVAAADDAGFVASDGGVTRAQVKNAMSGTSARHRVLCVDAPGGSRWADEVGSGDLTVLASTREQQRAWSRFFPGDDFVRFESAAAHGWSRALTKSGDGWKGDLGQKGSVCVEDLRLCGDEDSALAVPPQDGRRALDEALAMRTLESVRPAAARKLRGGGEVEISGLRTTLGKVRFEQLAGIIEALGSDALQDASGAVRRRFERALGADEPMAALQAAHEVLVGEGLIDTPSELETRAWKRLAPAGGGRVALVLPATQVSSFRGRADLAVLGGVWRSRYRLPYGRYDGKPGGSVAARLRVDLLGSCFRGRWEGEMDGKWLRGDWQGVFDPRTGKVRGRILNRTQPQDGGGRTPSDTVWPAEFEGSASDGGTRLSGTWRSAVPMLPASGRWRVTK